MNNDNVKTDPKLDEIIVLFAKYVTTKKLSKLRLIDVSTLQILGAIVNDYLKQVMQAKGMVDKGSSEFIINDEYIKF